MTSILVLVVAWWLVARFWVDNPLFLAGPAEVWRALRADVASGELWDNLRISLAEFAAGLAIGVTAGAVVGVFVGASSVVSDYADPFISASYSAPLVAFAPLLVLWFGIGMWSKIVLVAVVVLFPVLINVTSGVRTTSRALLEVGESFGANRRHRYLKILVPANVPSAMAGLRIGLGRALVAIVVAETFGSRGGIGHAINEASFTFDTARIFSNVIVLMVLGVVLMEIIRSFERRVAPWAFTADV